ncbi:MAG: hypothetical protein KKD86_18650 [Bacteroidetes bacterium]|nr:hypothetical protein [Bacteroidota bacterium]
MKKYLSVLRYPHDDNHLNSVIEVLNAFIMDRSRGSKINIKIKPLPTVELDSIIHDLLQKFLSFSEKHFNCLDIDQLFDLLDIIKNPTDKTLNVIKTTYKSNGQLLDFFHTARETASSLKVSQVFLFISLPNLELKSSQGPWGASKGIYPFSVAIDTTGYKEVIFHEFLHQLSVSEGYNEINYTNTCVSSCWMQYNATLGNSLCEKHSKELIKFTKGNQLS